MNVDIVDWNVIGKCNLRCLHCYGPAKNIGSLSEDEMLEIVDSFVELGVEWVVLTGGEPLLVKGIDSVIQYMSENGINVALSTNSMFVFDHQDTIEKYVSSLNIPIDGSTPQIHAVSRADEKSFYTFFEVLGFYTQHPKRRPDLLRVGTVYSAATQGDFVNIARLLEPYDDAISTWKIYELVNDSVQPDLRKSIIHEQGTIDAEMAYLIGETSLAPKIHVAKRTRRNKAYFMLNPRGQLIMPTDVNGTRYEMVVGDFRNDPLDKLVETWGERVALHNYFGNHDHYRK